MKSRQKVIAEALRITQDDAFYESAVSARSDFFVECTTVGSQVPVLQKILKDEDHENILEFLCVVYLAANSSETAALRRAAFGALRKLPPEKVAPVMWQRLSYLMEKNQQPTACVNEFSVLCAWQPHGLRVMEVDLPMVLNYLQRAMKSLQTIGPTHDREQSFDKASKVVRCSAVLSKSAENMAFVTGCASMIKEILLCENNTLSCRLACGVSLPEILILLETDPEELYKAQLPDLLPNPLAHVCFVAGMINVTPLDTQNEKFLKFYGELLSELCRLGSLEEFHKVPPFALTCSRTIVQWTEKLVNSKDAFAKLLDDRYETLLTTAALQAEHYVDAVQHQGRALMRIVFDALAGSPDQRYAHFLEQTFERLLREPHYKKSKYAPLTIIAKHVKVSPHITQDMIRDMYKTLNEKSMFPYVQDFLRDVGKVHLEESSSSWEDIWLNPFFEVFVSGNAPIIQNLVPDLLKLYPQLVDVVLQKCQKMPLNLLALKLLPVEKLLDHCSIVDEAQWSTDEKMRLALLHVMTDCPKSCEPLNPRLIPHLKTFLKLNCSTQSQALRQVIFSSFKKLIQRMHDSDGTYWERTGKVHPVYQEKLGSVLEQQKNFVTWMFDFCIGELRPGCNFFTRSTILMLLELLSPHVRSKWTPSTAATLLQCIKDTYESNKTAVLNILATIHPSLLPYYDKESASEKLNEFSAGDLPDLRIGLQTDRSIQPDDPENWVQQCILLTRSARPPDCVTAAYMLRIISASANPSDKLKIIETMSDELSSQIGIAADQGLVEASSASPMYGALTCLRTLLNDVLREPVPEKLIPEYRKILSTLTKQCASIAKIVSPLVTNASPEGQLQIDEHPELEEEFKQALFKGFGKNLEKADTVKACAVASQMLLLCCWRSHKEVSLTFGDIACHLSRLTEQDILAVNKVVDMGTFFMDELCTVRHRGAFEQAYVGFSSLCAALWRSRDPELKKYPSHWLNELISKITEGAVSSTRRSAGLPFIVQAVVVSEPEINNGLVLKEAMAALLRLAESESSEVARVHALNVLRVLFKDTRLGETIMAYVSRGMKTALEGFDHPVWGVRNSCTLLFSSLITRIFGVNRSKQDIERKNCLTGHMFFLRFPELYDFLIDRMTQLFRTPSSHPGLFPILLLFGRLFPSLDESKLDKFVFILDACSTSPIISIRKAAAKAFATILPTGQQDLLYSRKMDMFTLQDVRDLPANVVHGLLLQVQAILELPSCSDAFKRTVSKSFFTNGLFLEKRCSVVAALYIELLMQLGIRKPEVLKIQLSDFSAEGHTSLQHMITHYKCELGVIQLSDVTTDHQKMGFLEWSLKNTILLPAVMSEIIRNPEIEHPDVQKLAFDLAAKELHNTAKEQLENVTLALLDKLPSVRIPSVAVSVFSCIASQVIRLPVASAISAVELLRQYSAANQDPAMRSVASDLARKLLESFGRSIFIQARKSGVFLALCEGLINLVVDNDTYVRNQVISGIASITTENLRKSTPLDSLLALCAEMCAEQRDGFVRFLVNLALASEEAPLDVEFDEQPFEKGELNTFHDALVIADSCRRAVAALGVTQIEFPESRFDNVKAKVAAANACDLAFNRQLDADLVKLGQYYTVLSMREGQLDFLPQDTCLVSNAYFDRFKRTDAKSIP